jgi:protein-disulfide isomerase
MKTKIALTALALAAAVGLAGLLSLPTDGLAQAATEHPVLNERTILLDPDVPSLGNPKGDVTIVEYFDYQCPYCRKLHPDLMRLVKEDGKIRLVLKDWPILSPNSKVAATLALAAKYQGKYAETHAALMQTSGRLDHDKIRAAAVKAGLDLDRVDADVTARRAAIDAVLARNAEQADALGLTGTPALLVGPFKVPGLGYDELKKVVAEARARRKGQ